MESKDNKVQHKTYNILYIFKNGCSSPPSSSSLTYKQPTQPYSTKRQWVWEEGHDAWDAYNMMRGDSQDQND